MRVSAQTKLALLMSAWLAAPSVAWAAGEVNGRMSGVVTEAQTGAPVPGASITVSGKELIGGSRTVSTAEDGRYEIVELPPGSYEVQVSYSGVKPIKRRVYVRQGELMPLDIAWSAELAEAEVTVVVEERHMTRPDSTTSGTVVTADSSAKVATQRSYQNIAAQVAGVNGITGGNPSVKGSNTLNNKWLVDGLDISDALLNSFSANINFDSIASIEVLTGGMEAQYNAMGGVINLITQGGSDEWRLDSSLYIQNVKLSAPAQQGPATYLGEVPYSRVANAPTQQYQANLNFGGPIVKHRLWFHVSLQYSFTEASQPAGPPLNYQSPNRRFNGILYRLKLTWAPSEKHRITLSVSGDPAWIGNTTTGGANRRLPIAQTFQAQGGAFAILQWDYFISQHINTQVQTGFQYNNIIGAPMGHPLIANLPGGSVEHNAAAEAMYSDKNKAYNPDEPQHLNQTDSTVWYQGRTTASESKRYTFQFDPSISLRGKLGGSHDAKFGLQSRYILSTLDVFQTGRGVSYVDTGNAVGEAGLCDETTGVNCNRGDLKTITSDYVRKEDGYSIGAFVQDRWKPWRRLTILPGIRFDYGFTRNTLGQIVSNLFGVGPRLGFVLDLSGDQKTILSTYYGRVNDVSTLLPAARATPTAVATTYNWNPTTSAFDTFQSAAGGDKGYRIDPGSTTPPHTDQVAVSLRREVFANSVAGVEYTYKRTANLWDQREVNQIWDPSGYRVVGYVDPSTTQRIDLVTTNHNLIREYQGIDFWVEGRPTKNWDVYVAYTLSWNYGSQADQFAGQLSGTPGILYNPRQTMFYQGFLPEDTRHQFKLRVSYDNKGFNLGGFFQYVSGGTLSKGFFQYQDGGYLNLRAPYGTDPNTVNNPIQFSEFRVPDLLALNLRVSYDFHALIKQHLIVIVDFFNVFNSRTPTGINSNDIAALYGTVTTRQQPFNVQLGLRYLF